MKSLPKITIPKQLSASTEEMLMAVYAQTEDIHYSAALLGLCKTYADSVERKLDE